MNPPKIFLFGLGIIAMIIAIAFIFPADGWKVGAYTLHFPNFRNWNDHHVQYKNIQDIIAFNDTIDIHIEKLPVKQDTLASHADTATYVAPVFPADSLSFTDSIYVYPFEFPKGHDTLLYAFFRTLQHVDQYPMPVRILHYGDSQIEADVITARIRNFMQNSFGGQGIGLIPIVAHNAISVTVQKQLSPNWKRISLFNKNDSLIANQHYGITGNIARVVPDTGKTRASIGIRPYGFEYFKARTFTHARLYFGKANPFSIVINHTDTLTYEASDVISSGWWKFSKAGTLLDLDFSGDLLPDFYGITLDGSKGVAVDNIPLRGSSGLDFSRMDSAQMGNMFRMMNVKMLILQFGANIAAHVTNDYNYYARRFAQQLEMLKTLNPDITIIVIGINDMSQNSPEGYVSYPNITKIRDAQKQAAFATGCVFWDLYEAMGGENSMPSWVNNDPPLAQKDFVHFTYRGGKVIADLFCRAWKQEYKKWSSINTKK